MNPLLGGLITGGASLLGNLFSANTSAANTQAQIAAQEGMLSQTEQFNAQQAGQAQQFSANMQQRQMGFEEQMSGTAYQRAAMDMKMAGLNPAMMFGGGGAASTPAVASPSGISTAVGVPSVPMPQNRSPLGDLGAAASQAVNSAVAVKTFDRMTQEISNMQTDQALDKAKTVTEWQRPGQIDAEKLATDVARRLNEERIPPAALEAQSAKDVMQTFGDNAGALPSWLRQTINASTWLGDRLMNAISPFRGMVSGTGL